jgi:hypothetical protein
VILVELERGVEREYMTERRLAVPKLLVVVSNADVKSRVAIPSSIVASRSWDAENDDKAN